MAELRMHFGRLALNGFPTHCGGGGVGVGSVAAGMGHLLSGEQCLSKLVVLKSVGKCVVVVGKTGKLASVGAIGRTALKCNRKRLETVVYVGF